MRRLWLLGLVLVGCASVPPAPAAPCVPAEISAEFLAWPVVEARTLAAPLEGEAIIPLTRVRYQARGGAAVVAYWARGTLVALDPSPDTDAPLWIDQGQLMPDERTLRATPGAPCQWTRAGQTRA